MQSNRKTGVERADEIRRTLSPDEQSDVFGECRHIECPHCQYSFKVELVYLLPNDRNRSFRCPVCLRGAKTIPCFEVLPPYDELIIGAD